MLLVAACRQTPPPPRPAEVAPKVPQVRAVVIHLKTTIAPSNKVFTSDVVIANGKARSLDELDRWRLFDLASNGVTYVDDLTKSIRTESLTSLIAAHGAEDGSDGAKLAVTGTKKIVNGLEAAQYVLTRGGYRRELWMANLPNVPQQLFAMMQASRRPATPEGQKRWAEGPLASLRGFPMDDHAVLPYGTFSLAIDRTVTGVEQKDVPEALLVLPSGYRDVTAAPPKAPAAHPPAAASPPPGRTAPGAG